MVSDPEIGDEVWLYGPRRGCIVERGCTFGREWFAVEPTDKPGRRIVPVMSDRMFETHADIVNDMVCGFLVAQPQLDEADISTLMSLASGSQMVVRKTVRGWNAVYQTS